MSDSASQSTQPNESDFHDSHPLDSGPKEKSTPAIGDLSSIETSIDTPNSEAHSVGDITTIEDSSKSEIIGDISLLDEAFAEMGEDSSKENSTISNTSIPVLNESIETPSESKIISPSTQNASIPLLEQEATIFAEMLKPATDSAITSKLFSAPASQLVEDINEINTTPLFDSASAENNTNISEMNSSLEKAAELLSEAIPATIEADDAPKTNTEAPSEVTGDAALAALLDDDTTNTDTELLHTDTDSIDEKIAIAQSEIADNGEIADNSEITDHSQIIPEESEETHTEIHSQIHINETPISAIETDESSHSEFSASFAENLNSSLPVSEITQTDMLSTKSSEFSGIEISEFNPDIDLNNSANVTQASHSIGISSQSQDAEGSSNNLNLSIPFELHSQLSSKIDELVIQATSSITEELHMQLSTRLENLLANSVESVLPKLVNQMATELRSDINTRIKQQLPNIINDVLNKTRLHK